MRQVIQNQRTGKISIENLPDVEVKKGFVLIQNNWSLISAGTERSSVETAQASMIGKAKSRPDLVKQVLDNARKEGVLATYKKVLNRLNNLKDLGYCSAGLVLQSGVQGFLPGDRVACGGVGYASHAEIVLVPVNLVAKVPDGVTLDEAAFSTIGAIALQGVRQADVRIGEKVAVIGLGLLGLITVQILKAAGCKVIGLDVSTINFEKAVKLGCDECITATDDSISAVESFTQGMGTDAVIITAATKSNEPIRLAMNFARKRSTIIFVGFVGMNLPRSPFYEKELTIRIACSYGPGRYDQEYEERGLDYPIGYVRWTENRNMQAILELLQQKKIDMLSLVTHRIPLASALEAYKIITGKIKERYLGILIEYPSTQAHLDQRTIIIHDEKRKVEIGSPVIGFLGAGNFAQSYLLPPLKKMKIILRGIVTSKPFNAKNVAEKYGFEYCASNVDEILHDSVINTVFIASRHDSHAGYVINALNHQKHVFVEKPLAVTPAELENIRKAFEQRDRKNLILMVGFNRRFSPTFTDIKEFFQDRKEPLFIAYRVNAGFIPKTHWMQSPDQGGRIIGEGCHFIDCMQFLTGAVPTRVFARSIESSNAAQTNEDSMNATIQFSDGSIGNLIYLANGNSSLGKEYCEVTSEGRTAVMHNFKKTDFYFSRTEKSKGYNGKKGHNEEIESFIKTLREDGKPGISFHSIYITTLTTFKIIESMRSGTPMDIS
jgi:polar amino acid transport system substrate-binding protein